MKKFLRRILLPIAKHLLASIDYFEDRNNDIEKNHTSKLQIESLNSTVNSLNLALENFIEKVRNLELEIRGDLSRNFIAIENIRDEFSEELKTLEADQNQLKLDPYKNSLEFELSHMALNFLSMLSLNKVEESGLRRFGSNLDGGYVLINDVSKTDTIFSIGVGDDVSFDLAIANESKEVVLVDHTVEMLPIHIPSAIFLKKSLGSDLNGNSTTLAALLEEFKSEDYILKIDIEGAEWDVFVNASQETLLKFRQIVVEFHNLGDFSDPYIVLIRNKVLEKLNSTHAPVVVHANNFSPYLIIGGVPMPDTLEVTWIRKTSYKINAGKFSNLDNYLFPNRADTPEYLTWWNSVI
jgi:hypothetical protein